MSACSTCGGKGYFVDAAGGWIRCGCAKRGRPLGIAQTCGRAAMTEALAFSAMERAMQERRQELPPATGGEAYEMGWRDALSYAATDLHWVRWASVIHVAGVPNVINPAERERLEQTGFQVRTLRVETSDQRDVPPERRRWWQR